VTSLVSPFRLRVGKLTIDKVIETKASSMNRAIEASSFGSRSAKACWVVYGSIAVMQAQRPADTLNAERTLYMYDVPYMGGAR
jgi:hypothetical protein